ncbi:aryl-alcohol dehydrogenase-like predicted oxidoreductase [Evansella vedderi]|uniref:Aryl-alcohol dehydrogenase-like predicted oxidoreductase n=1 Tax=Evansella vedderi TaxID=38282 RepID=A0ABT9ZTA6_9BACI|nr:aldo/keto reductase [Evansella vedderi]MDQ0253405.1 aryl-alcohol dehydrogenase-like predicted oxidoreductase [Evansella vedderi]
MKYRRLGKTDLKVSVVGVGTWQFGGEWGMDFSQEEVNSILDKSKEVGINLIDTAECYGDHLSEKFIGNYLSNDKREDWIVATKFGHQFHANFERTNHWSAEEVLTQLEDSLKALKTDYIDLYQFHSGSDESFKNDELWTMLDKQVQAGKIRHLGISIGSNQNIYQTDLATEVNAKAIQVVYNRLEREPEEEVFPSCERQDLGVLARVPLASGYLSGKYKPGAVFGDQDVRHKHDQEDVARKLRLVEEIKLNEVPEGVNMAQWALAWCLKHPAVTTVIPGCKSPEQVELNASAASLDLVQDDHPQAVK